MPHTDYLALVQMRKAYKLRAYPTRPQETRAVRLLRDHCDLYNAALQERRDAWRMQRVSISYGDQSAQLKDIRATDPDGQGRHSFTSQQQTLRRLAAVFQAFCQRGEQAEKHRQGRGKTGAKKSERVGYPRFKPYQRFDQVMFVAGDGATWEPAARGWWSHARLQAVGRIKVKQHRVVSGQVKTLQLKREHRRWYVILVVDTYMEPLPPTGRSVGLDLGVARFLTASDGEIVDNPRFLDAAHATITGLQRKKDHAVPGSGNRKRLCRKLAREWRKVRNRRRDFHHKIARGLVDHYDAIALERLRVADMTASARGTVDEPGTMVAAKSGLNRSILDVGWGQFTRILAAKAASAGRQTLYVDPRNTSIDCHLCGARCTRPRRDTVVCPSCGEWDADLNGARNVATRAGLGSGQASAV
jgi:putative transposase